VENKRSKRKQQSAFLIAIGAKDFFDIFI